MPDFDATAKLGLIVHVEASPDVQRKLEDIRRDVQGAVSGESTGKGGTGGKGGKGGSVASADDIKALDELKAKLGSVAESTQRYRNALVNVNTTGSSFQRMMSREVDLNRRRAESVSALANAEVLASRRASEAKELEDAHDRAIAAADLVRERAKISLLKAITNAIEAERAKRARAAQAEAAMVERAMRQEAEAERKARARLQELRRDMVRGQEQLHAQALRENAAFDRQRARAGTPGGPSGLTRNFAAVQGFLDRQARGWVQLTNRVFRYYVMFMAAIWTMRLAVRPLENFFSIARRGFQHLVDLAGRFGTAVVGSVAQIQNLSGRMRVFFGPATEDAVGWAIQQALGKPFEWTGIAEGMMKAMAMGVENFGSKFMPLVMDVGMDMAAAYNKPVADTVMALMQAAAGNWARMIRSFGFRPGEAVPFGGIQGKGERLDSSTMQNRIRNLEAILRMVKDRVGGAATALSDTWGAMIEDLKDAWTSFALILYRSGFLRPVLAALSLIRQRFVEMRAGGLLQQWAERFTQALSWIRNPIGWLAEKVPGLTAALVQLGINAATAFGGWYDRMGGIEGIMQRVFEWTKNMIPVAMEAGRIYLEMALAIYKAFFTIGKAIAGVIQAVSSVGADIMDWMGNKGVAKSLRGVSAGAQEAGTILNFAEEKMLGKGSSAESAMAWLAERQKKAASATRAQTIGEWLQMMGLSPEVVGAYNAGTVRGGYGERYDYFGRPAPAVAGRVTPEDIEEGIQDAGMGVGEAIEESGEGIEGGLKRVEDAVREYGIGGGGGMAVPGWQPAAYSPPAAIGGGGGGGGGFDPGAAISKGIREAVASEFDAQKKKAGERWEESAWWKKGAVYLAGGYAGFKLATGALSRVMPAIQGAREVVDLVLPRLASGGSKAMMGRLGAAGVGLLGGLGMARGIRETLVDYGDKGIRGMPAYKKFGREQGWKFMLPGYNFGYTAYHLRDVVPKAMGFDDPMGRLRKAGRLLGWTNPKERIGAIMRFFGFGPDAYGEQQSAKGGGRGVQQSARMRAATAAPPFSWINPANYLPPSVASTGQAVAPVQTPNGYFVPGPSWGPSPVSPRDSFFAARTVIGSGREETKVRVDVNVHPSAEFEVEWNTYIEDKEAQKQWREIQAAKAGS